MNSNIGTRVVAIITLLIMVFSFIISDGYPFMGQNNEIIDSQTYISDKLIYPFDGTNINIKLIEDKVILSKTPKFWPSSSIALEKNEGIYQEFYLYDENEKMLNFKINDSPSQISMSNNFKINPVVIKTTTITKILNEEDLLLFFTLIQVDNDSFRLSLENYGNYDIESVMITYGFIDELNIYFDGYNHGYYEDWKRYNIQEGDSINIGFIANKSIKIHIKNLKTDESKLYSITKNYNK